MLKKPSLFALGAIGALGLAILPHPAQAVEVEKMVNCSSGSMAVAELELEYRVFDLSFDIDTRNAGERWRFTLNQNGKRVASLNLESMKDYDDSYAEVEWDLVRPDRGGRDTFKFRAVNQSTGEVCKATIRA